MMPSADRIYDPSQGAKKDITDTSDDVLAIGPALRIIPTLTDHYRPLNTTTSTITTSFGLFISTHLNSGEFRVRRQVPNMFRLSRSESGETGRYCHVINYRLLRSVELSQILLNSITNRLNSSGQLSSVEINKRKVSGFI